MLLVHNLRTVFYSVGTGSGRRLNTVALYLSGAYTGGRTLTPGSAGVASKHHFTVNGVAVCRKTFVEVSGLSSRTVHRAQTINSTGGSQPDGSSTMTAKDKVGHAAAEKSSAVGIQRLSQVN